MNEAYCYNLCTLSRFGSSPFGYCLFFGRRQTMEVALSRVKFMFVVVVAAVDKN